MRSAEIVNGLDVEVEFNCEPSPNCGLRNVKDLHRGPMFMGNLQASATYNSALYLGSVSHAASFTAALSLKPVHLSAAPSKESLTEIFQLCQHGKHLRVSLAYLYP